MGKKAKPVAEWEWAWRTSWTPDPTSYGGSAWAYVKGQQLHVCEMTLSVDEARSLAQWILDTVGKPQ
jgi:hypothetical protein